jgi:hypothetical protein
VVEFQPSKLAVVGSNPIARSNVQTCGVKRETSRPSLEMVVSVRRFTFCDSRFTERDAHVAQLVEHVLGKDEVTRSIRVVGSIQSLLDLRAHTRASETFRKGARHGEGEI